MSAIRVADYMELNHFFCPVIFQFYSKESFLKVMDKIAEKHDATDAQVAINWVRSHDFAGTALVVAGSLVKIVNFRRTAS